MTIAPDMLMQYGGVPVGAHRLAEIFNAGNIWFVDGDNGNASNHGKQPDWAFAKPSEAVTAATREGLVYIRPRSTTTTTDVYYSDNITVPMTKPLMQFIGCGAGTIPGYRGSAQLRVSTTTSPLFTVQTSGVVIENLQLNVVDATSSGCTVVTANRSASYQATSLQMRNNRIVTGSGSSSTHALQMGSCQYSLIEDNIFFDCPRSIHLESVYGSPQSNIVRRNIFSGLKAVRDVDIMITMTDINSRGHVIADNIFTDDLPNAATSGGWKRFIQFSSTSAVSTGIICGNYFADATANSCGTAGAIVMAPATWLVVGNYYEGTSATGLSGFVTKA